MLLNSSNRSRMSLGSLARYPDFIVSICRLEPFAQVMTWGVPLISTFSISCSGWVARKIWSRFLRVFSRRFKMLLTATSPNPSLNKTKYPCLPFPWVDGSW